MVNVANTTIIDENTIVFKNLLRRVKITPASILSVKATGIYDYRAHIVLRTKNHLPIGYRCRQYENAPTLAKAVLAIVGSSTDVKTQPNALKLLQHVTRGKTEPLDI